LKLGSIEEWKKYCKRGDKPKDLPNVPFKVYQDQWKDWGDWLGTGTIAANKRVYRSFEEARQFVRSLGLKNLNEWNDYRKSPLRPKDIPTNPNIVYKQNWKDLGDWLGTGTIASKNLVYRPFEEARQFVRGLHLKGEHEWREYAKSKNKPIDIPYKPVRTYRKEWKDWGDWLGTGNISPTKRIFRSYVDARTFVHDLKLETWDDWVEYAKSDKRPIDIPSNPNQVYTNEWQDKYDWLGTEERFWSVRKIKELLRGLIDSGIIYQWDEAVLFSFLHRNGLLNLHGNRHSKFFKNLISATRTEKGRIAIEEYVNSESEEPPSLETKSFSYEIDQEIQRASSHELSKLVDNDDPLDYQDIRSASQILENTNILESINVDEEAIQFYVHYSLNELWKSAFRNEKETFEAVKLEGKNGNKYHDLVIESFLLDYQKTRHVKTPEGYSFPYRPSLMQLFISHKLSSQGYFGNFSGTGAGKTLSAVLASRVINSKMTLIICPNDVVNQWDNNITEIFPNSKVTTGREAFHAKYLDHYYQYLILNYDKFSQPESPNLILKLVKEKIDFVILDEIHFVKKRDEASSQRRRNLEGLLTAVRKKNPGVKILGLSATPVVNNLMEGKSLLEMLTGKIYDDIGTTSTIHNAVTLYEKLSTISIRELPQYNIDVYTKHIHVTVHKPERISIKELKRNPLVIEQILSEAKIPEILRYTTNQTIIYTEYVTEIVNKLSRALDDAGYTHSFYTGSNHHGLKLFLDKKVNVLVSSRPISTGVDGLQHICNRLIINSLPWTNAQYQQLIGRLVRKGQQRDNVNVFVIEADLDNYPYDQLKWNRIQFKRTLADCAVDGRLPEKNLITPQQAASEAVKWLERLERGKVSTIVRRDLDVVLSPIEIKHRLQKYGDFTKLNNHINNENSFTTHKRFLEDPQEWDEYHRQYREARKSWLIIPFEEVIKRIKQFSKRYQIGDFGCGEAKIMEDIGEERVYSFDHIAINNKVIACDMKKVPISDEDLDVAIFSLSLMGKNWKDYILESKRCLVTNGTLLIAETTKSLKGRLSQLREHLEQNGFEIYIDEERGDFTFIEARKI
jgi:superfamily II DNA or RNA helicase